jgi:hypothetical protein
MLYTKQSSLIILWIASLAAGCGAHRPAPRLFQYADLVRTPAIGKDAFKQPIILEFAPGDRLPIELGFADRSFALDPATPTLALVAKERCFVRIDDSGIRTSRASRSFDDKPDAPGSFSFGFAHRTTGPALSLQVRTPTKH